MIRRQARLLACAAAIGVAALSPSAAWAETLREAMAAAYAGNPDITAARAGQRINAEQLIQAETQVRPTLSGVGLLDQEMSNPGTFDDRSRLLNATIELAQPVYRGGRVRSSIRAADRRVMSGREQLRAVENQLMLDTVVVYMDVLADQSEVELTENNVLVLERQLQASSDRFEVGDVTRTDVAQSEARLALARSQYITAQGRLANSRAAYERVVGHPPEDLQPPPLLPPLPGTQGQAVDLALAENPFIIAARFQEDAAEFDVDTARGARLPSIDATFGIGYSNFRGIVGGGGGLRSGGADFTQNVGATISIPIYQQGLAGSQIREARARASQLREDTLSTERTTIDNARSAWEDLQTALATIDAAEVAVDANELALEGVRAENSVGTRTILDVLDAEQELLNAQVQLVRAERNSYVAGFALLAAIGRAEADDLGLPVELYDAPAYLDRADNQWLDWDSDVEAQPLRTRVIADVPEPTVGPPVPQAGGVTNRSR